jgi:hypothetical protein
MANPRIRFTTGFDIRFGSLDFFCIGVDHNLVRLPPSCRSVMLSFWAPMSASEA